MVVNFLEWAQIWGGEKAVHGIVLGIALIFLVFIKSINRREVRLKIVYKKRITFLIHLFNLLMVLYIVYLFFTQSTYMYVRRNVVENLFSAQPVSEAEVAEETTITRVPIQEIDIDEYIRNIVSFIWDNRDIIAGIFFIIISIIIYLFRKKIVFAPYCDYVKRQLYKLNHCWLSGKSLKNLLVSVSVWQDDNNYEQDICRYFSHELENSDPDRYIILGNPGEGKTVSIRKLGNMLLDARVHAQQSSKPRIRGSIISIIQNGIVRLWSPRYIPVIFNVIDIKRINKVEEMEEEVKNIIYSKSKILKLLRGIKQIKKSIYHIIEKNMDNGRFVFFFDGMDEISAENSYDLKNIIFKFQEKFPKCFYIFSSRTAVFYERSDMHFNKEKILKLLPFSKEKILIFLKKWEFEKESECWTLYEKILNSYQLERLASNPLLLTLIAYLYEHSELNEPESIADFYQKALTCLLDKWEDEKKILKRTKVDLDIKYIFLERTAYWLFENEETFFKKSDIFKEVLDLNQYGIELNTIFNEIYLHSGILEKTKNGSYKFYHRSFYEYFLASYLVRNHVDALNDERYTANSQVMFFYLSLKDNSKITELYIKNNLNKESIIDSIILECKIENPEIIRFYLLKKKWSKRRKNEDYYAVLGWTAEKYSYLEPQIRRELFDELHDAIQNKRNKQIVYVLQAFSRFMEVAEVADLIKQNIDQINILYFSRYSSIQLEPCIIELFFRTVYDGHKAQIIYGLCMARRYNTILLILNKRCSENDIGIIFSEMLFETKDKLFVQWFDKQEIWKYIDEKVIKQVKKWEKLYGWRWHTEDIDLRRKRYLMVYYLLYTDRNCASIDDSHRNWRISNRIKFVASYIKNVENSYSEVKPFFVDIPDYQVISNDEFRLHWKKANLKERLLFNPIIINMIQWGTGLLMLLIICVYFLTFRGEAETFQDYLYSMMHLTLEEDRKLFDQINRLVQLDSLYNIKISDYLTMDAHMFIFYSLWILFQIDTYKEFIYFPFSRRIIALYIAIACAYLAGYAYIFSDIVFRMCGIIIVIVIFTFAVIQHRRNMPSFRQPQFENIRSYLEKDIF